MKTLLEYRKFKKEIDDYSSYGKRRIINDFIEEKYLSPKTKMLYDIFEDEPTRFIIVVALIYVVLTTISFVLFKSVIPVAIICGILPLIIPSAFLLIDEYNFLYRPFCRKYKNAKIKDKENEKIKKELKESMGEAVSNEEVAPKKVKRKENDSVKILNNYNQIVQNSNVNSTVKRGFNNLVERTLKYHNLVVEKRLSLAMFNKIVGIYIKELSALIIMEEEGFYDEIVQAISRVLTLVNNEIDAISESSNIKGKSCLTALNNMLDQEMSNTFRGDDF